MKAGVHQGHVIVRPPLQRTVRGWGKPVGAQPGLVVHVTRPARRPVRAISPGAVAAHPGVIGHQRRINPPQALGIGKVEKILPFRPRQHLGSGGGWIEALETICSVRLADFPTDKTIWVLLGVKIIERALKIKRRFRITGKQGDERRIPHEQIAVESRVHVGADKLILGAGVLDKFRPFLLPNFEDGVAAQYRIRGLDLTELEAFARTRLWHPKYLTFRKHA